MGIKCSGALKNTSHLGQKDARDKRARAKHPSERPSHWENMFGGIGLTYSGGTTDWRAGTHMTMHDASTPVTAPSLHFGSMTHRISENQSWR
jgi:hypothetical protein